MINTACPKCNTYFNLKDELAFKKVKCPNCWEIFQIIWLEQNNIGTKENLNYFRNSFLNKILKFKLNRLAFFILIIIIIILFLVIDSFTFNNKFFFLRKIIYGLSIIILSIIRLYRLNYIEKD